MKGVPLGIGKPKYLSAGTASAAIQILKVLRASVPSFKKVEAAVPACAESYSDTQSGSDGKIFKVPVGN